MNIKFVKQVTFRDRDDGIVHVYNIGDVIPFTGKTETYYVTAMGGIFFDEAVEVSETA